MNNRNYQKELDRLIEKLDVERPRLLLHACCGVCSAPVLEYLTQYFDVTLLWYNPNLYPQEEFDRRFRTLREMLVKMGFADKVSVLTEAWRHEDYDRAAAGLESEPEGGARCTACFRLRLTECARIAAQHGFAYYCTTLTLSRHKDEKRINRLGEEIGRAEGVRWLPSDFKKQGREMRSTELTEQLGLYRQLYCGCEYSLHVRETHGQEQS